MPEIRAGRPGRPEDGRSPDDRLADHAGIDRLVDDLLPALVAKLGATGLGEIEVREGAWRVRLRRPGDGPGSERRGADRPSRAQPGHAGHGHAPGAVEGHRAARTAHSTNGSHPPGLSPVGPGRESGDPESPRRSSDDRHRLVATAPAVGIYRPRPDITAGTRVRAGDRLGAVDVLGVPQDVVAPADGIVGASFAEAGQAVEYGQEIVAIELSGAPSQEAAG